MPAGIAAAGAAALGHLLGHVKGRWIRRTAALAAVVETLRNTPRPGLPPAVGVKLGAALRIVRESPDDSSAQDAAMQDVLNALDDVNLEEIRTATQRAQAESSPKDRETHLMVALQAVGDPVLAAAEDALLRHIQKLHPDYKDPRD